MADLFYDLFQPLRGPLIDPQPLAKQGSLGMTIARNHASFPDLEEVQIALIGVSDDRNSPSNTGCAEGPDAVRAELYKLYPPTTSLKIADLGNIAAGYTTSDTYYALKKAIEELIKLEITPIIIGGGHDLAYGQYLAYEELERMIDILVVDDKIDFNEVEDEGVTHDNVLHAIAAHEPSYLFHMGVLGYQRYLTQPDYVEVLDKLFFDHMRLGEIRKALDEAEPAIRQADMVTFDISAIRASDAPGNRNAGPNGFMAHEACQIARYIGLSDKCSSVGFYEYNPNFDHMGVTAKLVAQMVWHVLEGYGKRVGDYPNPNNRSFIKYIASIKEGEHEIVFYKSRKSGRWWMEVPAPDRTSLGNRPHLVPCSYADYLTACQEEVPDKWWRAFQKFA